MHCGHAGHLVAQRSAAKLAAVSTGSQAACMHSSKPCRRRSQTTGPGTPPGQATGAPDHRALGATRAAAGGARPPGLGRAQGPPSNRSDHRAWDRHPDDNCQLSDQLLDSHAKWQAGRGTHDSRDVNQGPLA